MPTSSSNKDPVGRTRRRHLAVPLTVLVALIVGWFLLVPAPASATPAAPTVVVSLTWDDGRASQTGTLGIQAKYGFPATYYINSGEIGTSSYNLTKGQLDTVAASGGNEVGGHTEHHDDLTTLSNAKATAAVCADRQRLIGWYGPAAGKSFAYPFGAVNATAESIVQSCGYQSGRGVGGLRGVTSCQSCPFAEKVPPTDAYWLAAVSSVVRTTTLADLEQRVIDAEGAGGGWLMYILHDLGVPESSSSADPYNIDPVVYDQFLQWLSTRSNVQVKTVAAAMAGPQLPAPPAPPDPSQNLLQNSDLERDDNANGVADCWQRSGYGTNSFSWARVGGAHSGAAAEEVTITSRTSGDRKLVTQQDNGICAPALTAGTTYTFSAWYQATVPVTMVGYYRDSGGTWRYWVTGPSLQASSAWKQAVFTPPALPAGASSMSFGVALTSVGTLRVDDLMLSPLVSPSPDVTPPQVNLTQPVDGSQVAGTVAVTANASDDRTVSKVEFFAGAQLIGTDTTAPYAASWDSKSAADGPVVLSARATDGAGLVSAVSSRSVTVLNNAPVSTILNSSLEAVATDTSPTCFTRTGYGTSTFKWTHTTDSHSGIGAEKLDVSSRTSGDRKLVIKMDGGQAAGGCAPDVTVGHSYGLSVWYKSTAPTAIVTYYRNAAGTWTYWQTGPTLPATPTWTKTTYQTANVPAGATSISYGLALATPGSVVVDDFSLSGT